MNWALDLAKVLTRNPVNLITMLIIPNNQSVQRKIMENMMTVYMYQILQGMPLQHTKLSLPVQLLGQMVDPTPQVIKMGMNCSLDRARF